MESPTKLFASVLALTAFAVAVVSGIASGADGASTLKRAIVSMLVCYALGAVLGMVAGRAIREYLHGYVADHPIDSMDDAIAGYITDEPDETTDGAPRAAEAA